MLFWQMKLDMQKREARTAFGIMMALAVCSFFVSAREACSHGKDTSELLPAYAYAMLHMSIINPIGTVYLILTPLAVSIPFSGGLSENNSLSYASILLGRCSKTRLILVKAFSAFFIGALMVLLPAVLNLIWCVIAFPLNSMRNPINAISSMPVIDFFLSRIYMKNLYVIHPYLYSFLGLFSASFFGGICALVTLTFSLLWDKHRLIVGAMPFLIVLLISLIGQAFQGLTGGATEVAPVYAYFITADDARKLSLPMHITIWALVLALACTGVLLRVHHKDEL